jgi:hypothetical protein
LVGEEPPQRITPPQFLFELCPVESHERGIHSALDIVELAKELPLTYKIGQVLPDVFSDGCKECFGRKGGIEWSFDDHQKADDLPAPGIINHSYRWLIEELYVHVCIEVQIRSEKSGILEYVIYCIICRERSTRHIWSERKVAVTVGVT